MSIPNPFKAQKLKITAIATKKVFEAMFNPSQYVINQQIKWEIPYTLTPITTDANSKGTVAGEPRFKGLEYGEFEVKLILDGTGATAFSWTTGFGLSVTKVKDRVDNFLEVCYNINEQTHSPPEIKVNWGNLEFIGYLNSVKINYTLFDTAGNALRAELDTSFKIKSKDVKLSSPDLTHIREVHEGDTLPLLSKAIYGSSRYYLLIAEANNLDDFRDLKAGMKLYFPPLDTQI